VQITFNGNNRNYSATAGALTNNTGAKVSAGFGCQLDKPDGGQ